MVPYSWTPDKGLELPRNGTAAEPGCSVCSRRFSVMYYDSNGKALCGDHIKRPNQSSEGN